MPGAFRKAAGATAPRRACEHPPRRMTSRWALFNAKILRRGWAPPEDICELEISSSSNYTLQPTVAKRAVFAQSKTTEPAQPEGWTIQLRTRDPHCEGPAAKNDGA